MYHAPMRPFLVAAVALAGCAPNFANQRTPSGDFCADMQIIPNGTNPERPYHRLGPVVTAPGDQVEAQRLEALRRAACRLGADAVIEAQNEERSDAGRSYVVSEGTAVVWTK